MTVAFRSPNGITATSTGSVNTAGNVGLTINVPSGVQDGDVMFMAIHAASSSGNFSASAAWTVVEAQFSSTGQASSKMMVWRRVASSEPASYTITWGAAGNTGRAAGGIIAFTGVDTSSPQQDEAKDAGAGPTSTEVLPSVTPTTATMILGIVGAYTPTTGTAVTWTPPGTMTERGDSASNAAGSSNASMEWNTESVSSGATGTRTATGSLSDLRPCGVMIALNPAASGTTVTPGVLALVLATFAPSVTATANQTATPGVKALALTTFAPVIALSVVPATKALSLATFAPAVTASDHKTATPSLVALSLATFAPTVTVSAAQTVTPGTAALAMTAFAPTVVLTDHKVVVPSPLGMTLTAFAPNVVASDHKLVTPPTLAMAMTAFAPTVVASDQQVATPDTASLVLTSYAPSPNVALAIPPLRSTATASVLVPGRDMASLVVPQNPTAEID